MKKFVSIILVCIIVMGLSLTVSAATPSVNPIAGDSKSVTKTINSGKGMVSLTVYQNTSVAKNQLDYVNQARANAGVGKLSWNSKMEDAALTRAMEQYFAPSHTRPDGSKFNTVDSLVNGENLAGGTHPDYYSGKNVFDDWMGSTGHRTNILDKDYKSMFAVSISTDTGSYWVQLFSVDAGSSTEKDAAAKDTATKNGTSNNSAGAAVIENIKKLTGTNSAIKVQNGGKFTAKEIGDINTKAGGKAITIYADTLYTGGKTQGRMFIIPANLKGRTTDYKLGVYTDDTVKGISDKFDKYFANKTAIIKIEEENLGVSTRIAADVSLTDMNTENLVFYTYNAAENKYFPINKPNYSVDDNGFLHFYTSVGGYIIVSEGSLAKK